MALTCILWTSTNIGTRYLDNNAFAAVSPAQSDDEILAPDIHPGEDQIDSDEYEDSASNESEFDGDDPMEADLDIYSCEDAPSQKDQNSGDGSVGRTLASEDTSGSSHSQTSSSVMPEEGHYQDHVNLDSERVPDETRSTVGSRLRTLRNSQKRKRADFDSSTGFSGPYICEECDLVIDVLELLTCSCPGCDLKVTSGITCCFSLRLISLQVSSLMSRAS